MKHFLDMWCRCWYSTYRTLALLVLLSPLLMLIGCGSSRSVSSTAANQAAAPTATDIPPTTVPTGTPTPTATPTSTATPTPEPQQARFAVIGDFGLAGQPAADVAALVKSWNPDFVVTTGDNNYPMGAAETIDANIGQYYHEFLPDGTSAYGPGSPTNRFFPTLGNHDADIANGQAYFDYFSFLPGNKRYYTVDWPPVRIYAVNSVYWIEPDGVKSDSVQAMWLRDELAASPDTWNIVVFHHPPYGSAYHGPSSWMRWPYQEWGADVVLSGHNHVYERIMIDGFPYITNGLGGGARYAWGNTIAEGSVVRFNADHGAQLVEATEQQLTMQFITRTGEVIDTFILER